MQDQRITPLRIDANRAAGTVAIGWADGHETTYDGPRLRWLCPCAFCRGEMGMPGWLDTNPTLTSEQTRLVDVALVGTYAIQPTWGDGHATGFHTFHLLREWCPCDACAREREQRARDATEPAAGGGERHWHGGHR